MRALRAIALVLVATLLPAACGKSEERKSLNVNTLTEAGASLALTTGDVTSSFTAAAVDSREKGNSKGETARQLLSAAMLAGGAFEEPRPDYKPGDQAMRDDIAFYFAQYSGAELSATYGLHSGGWKASNPETLATALAEATALSLLIACYNYAAPDGYRSIRNRMRRLDMPLAPDYWVNDAGNLALPDGDASDDQIELFDEWREPSKGTNPLWSAVLGPDGQALANVFRPAAERAFE